MYSKLDNLLIQKLQIETKMAKLKAELKEVEYQIQQEKLLQKGSVDDLSQLMKSLGEEEPVEK